MKTWGDAYRSAIKRGYDEGYAAHCASRYENMKTKNRKEATELEYLKWFRCEADFGPADGDVKYLMDKAFEKETGKRVPSGWCHDDDEEE